MPSQKPDTRGIDVDTSAKDDEESVDGEGAENEDAVLEDEKTGEEGASEDEKYSDEPGGEDEEEYDEGVEEVEAEEVVPAARSGHSKRRPAAKRASRPAPRETPGPGRRIWVVVVAILIIVPVIGLVYFFYGPSGEIQRMDLIAQPYTDSFGISGLSLVAQLDTGKPSRLSGTADLLVSFKGNTTYTGTMGISDSQGSKTIPLGRFAIGNGEYTVQAKFQGKASSTTFMASGIIERLNITAYNITRMTNSTLEYGTARMGVRVIFMSASFETQMATANEKLDIEITGGGGVSKFTENIASKLQLNTNYSLPGNGNYTVKATFHNSKVKADSQYSTITTLANDAHTNGTYVMVFIPPKAEAGPDQTVQWKLADGGGKVTLDGSNSIGYGGAKVEFWTWDYGDGYIEDGMKVTYTFQNRDTYFVTLLVSDNNGNTDTDTVRVTVN